MPDDILNEYQQYKTTAEQQQSGDADLLNEYSQYKQTQNETAPNAAPTVLPGNPPQQYGAQPPVTTEQPQVADIPRQSVPIFCGGISYTPPNAEDYQKYQTQLQGQEKTASDIDAQTAANLQQRGLTNQSTIPNATNEDIGLIQRGALGLQTNFASKQGAFKKIFPEGDIQEIKEGNSTSLIFSPKVMTDPGTGKVMAMEPYVRLSPNTAQSILWWTKSIDNPAGIQNKAETGRAFVNMMASFAADNPREAFISLATTLAFNPEAGLALNALAMGTSAAATGAAVNAAASSEGVPIGTPNKGNQHSIWNQIPHQAITDAYNDTVEGLEALAGAKLMQAPVAALKIFQGHPLVKVSEQFHEAFEALARLVNRAKEVGDTRFNDVGFMVHQASDNPFVRKAAGIFSNVWGQVQQYKALQEKLVSSGLQRSVDKSAIEAAPGYLETAQKQGTAKALAPVTSNPVSVDEMGAAANRSLGGYSKRSQEEVNAAYARVPSEADTQFDPAPALEAANAVGRGVKMPAGISELDPRMMGEYTSGPDLMLPKGDDPEFYKKLDDIANESNFKYIQQPSPELQKTIDQINTWKDTPPAAYVDKDGFVHTVTSQIQAMRQNLWDLGSPGPAGEVRKDAALARKLYNSLTEMLESNPNPELKTASAAARQRYENLEDPLVRRGYKQAEGELLSTEEGAALSVGNSSKTGSRNSLLDRYKAMMTPEDYQTFLQGIRTNVFGRDPENLSKKLANMEPGYAKRVFGDEQTLNAWKNAAQAYDQLNEVGVTKALRGSKGLEPAPDYNFERGAQALDTILQQTNDANATGRADTLQYLIRQSSTDPEANDPLARSIEGGLFNYLVKKAVVDFKGDSSIQPQPFEKIYQKYNDETLMRFLSPDSQQLLKDTRQVIQWIQGGPDVGASLQGSEIVARAAQFKTDVLITLFEHFRLGKWFTSPTIRRVLYGLPETKEGETNPVQTLLRKATEGLTGSEPTDYPEAIKRVFVLLNPVANVTGSKEKYTSAKTQKQELEENKQ